MGRPTDYTKRGPIPPHPCRLSLEQFPDGDRHSARRVALLMSLKQKAVSQVGFVNGMIGFLASCAASRGSY